MSTLSESLQEDGAKKFGDAIIKSFEALGLGILSKNDFEAFIFHHLALNANPGKLSTNYDWMRVLKLTPSKLRSLQLTRSAKFLDLDLNNSENWKLIFNSLEGKKLETEDKENGKVRVYIDDLHVHRLIEKFIIEGGSSVDYTLNRNQLVIKYSEFLYLLDSIYKIAKKEPLINAINEDRSELNIKKEFDSLESIFKDLKDALKDKAYDKVAEFALTNIIKIVKKKLGL